MFSGEVLRTFPKGSVAIGHTRYSSEKRMNYLPPNDSENVSPFVSNYFIGRVAASHNGRITNSAEIRDKLIANGLEFNSTSDCELIASLIAYCIMRVGNSYQAIVRAAKVLDGAFSLVVMCSDGRLIAVRDPMGYRPLCLGKSEDGLAIASESCALDCSGFEFVRDVKPGEIIIIQNGKIISDSIELKAEDSEGKRGGLCLLEYVYFARLDSVIDGLSVYEARHRMGAILAREHPAEADIVCGIPDNGTEIARGYSGVIGIKYHPCFVVNKYVGRSFIYPTQTQRDDIVNVKFNALKCNVAGKRVVLIDDSIVRGTTTLKAVRALRNAGAKEVHLRISSPPCMFGCRYGTDTGDEMTLIAHNRTVEEIRVKIEADSLGYISLEGLKDACRDSEVPFCTGCFTGCASQIVGQTSLI
jgi:amidophosphoribosyltransferase